MTLIAFMVGVFVGYIVNEKSDQILNWLESSIQNLIERKKKHSKKTK